MSKDLFSPKKALMVTRMIFLGQVMGVLFFMIIVFYMGKENFMYASDFSSPFFILLFLLTVVVVPVVYLYARRRLSGVKPEDPLQAKYAAWQYSVIIRLASCEGVALFSAVSLFITSNLFFAIFFPVALVILALNYPSNSKISRELNLTQAEIERFYQEL